MLNLMTSCCSFEITSLAKWLYPMWSTWISGWCFRLKKWEETNPQICSLDLVKISNLIKRKESNVVQLPFRAKGRLCLSGSYKHVLPRNFQQLQFGALSTPFWPFSLCHMWYAPGAAVARHQNRTLHCRRKRVQLTLHWFTSAIKSRFTSARKTVLWSIELTVVTSQEK